MRPGEIRIQLDAVPTAELLRLYERAFAPLDPIGRRRMLAIASAHGWDREWDAERLAA